MPESCQECQLLTYSGLRSCSLGCNDRSPPLSELGRENPIEHRAGRDSLFLGSCLGPREPRIRVCSCAFHGSCERWSHRSRFQGLTAHVFSLSPCPTQSVSTSVSQSSSSWHTRLLLPPKETAWSSLSSNSQRSRLAQPTHGLEPHAPHCPIICGPCGRTACL